MIGIPSFAGAIGASSWTPMNLTGIYQWFDATDAGSITKDGSDNVTQWADKTGNAGHLTASGTAGPLYVASSINSKPALTFDSSKGLDNSTNYGLDFLRAQNAASIIMVAANVSRTTDDTFIYWSNGADAGFTRFELDDSTAKRVMIRMRQADAGSRYDDISSASYLFPETDPYVWRVSLDLANKKPYQYLSTHGDTQDVQNASALSTSNAFSDTRSLAADLGGGTTTAPAGANYKVGELILTRSILTSDEITKVNLYLKAKWGIT
jgi:hypothetical protein